MLTYADPASDGLTWDQATKKLAGGECAFESFNDSAYGELVADGATEQTIGCGAVPGHRRQLPGRRSTRSWWPATPPTGATALDYLQVVASPEATLKFNAIKGSVPVRTDVPLTSLSAYQQSAAQALRDKTFLLSIVHGEAMSPAFQQGFYDAIATYRGGRDPRSSPRPSPTRCGPTRASTPPDPSVRQGLEEDDQRTQADQRRDDAERASTRQMGAPRGEQGEQARGVITDTHTPARRAPSVASTPTPASTSSTSGMTAASRIWPDARNMRPASAPRGAPAVGGEVRDEIGQEARRPQAPRRHHDIESNGPRGRLLPRVAQQQQQGAEAGDAAVDPLPQQRRHFLRRRVGTRLVHVHGDTLDHALR